MRFKCASRTHVGLKRKINEDSILVDAERGLWAVADGMGGHEAGEIASAMVTDALRCLPSASAIEQLARSAADALGMVNRHLVDLARSKRSDRPTTIGTTIVGLIVAGGSFSCFWVGDSRCYRYSDKKITRLTHDHSVVQNLVDAGLVRPEEADAHGDANLITRAVGAAEKFKVDFVSGEARAGDQFLLASDGLTRVVSDVELAAALEPSDLESTADQLLDMVMARGAPDNVSLIIVTVLPDATDTDAQVLIGVRDR